MKTQKNVNTSTSKPVYGSQVRTGNYPANFGTFQTGTDFYRRVLTRSTGVWKAGQGRKPEQPYQNTTAQYFTPQGVVIAYERNTGYGEHKHTFTGRIGQGFTLGFQGSMVPAHHGGSVASFPAYDAEGVNPDLLSQAEVKALNKLDQFSFEKGDASVDFAVAAGERRETARLLASASLGVLNLARAVSGFSGRGLQWEFGVANVIRDAFGVNVSPARLARKYARRRENLRKRTLRGEMTKGAATASLMADVWLTYRLGVTPLMSELDGLYNISQQKAYQRDNWSFRVSARHYVERAGVQKRGIDYKNSGFQELYVSELHGYTCTLVAAPVKKELDRLAQFGLDNLPGTIWELTTFSFVVDYFVNVGDFLSSLNVRKRFEFIDGSWTQRIVRQYSTVLSGPGTMARGFCSFDHTKRHVYTTFPVPMPPLSLSGEDLTIKRFLTMASLSIVKLRKLLQ